MLSVRQGDIVLVPVPFTDLTSTRKRPVIVVSAWFNGGLQIRLSA